MGILGPNCATFLVLVSVMGGSTAAGFGVLGSSSVGAAAAASASVSSSLPPFHQPQHQHQAHYLPHISGGSSAPISGSYVKALRLSGGASVDGSSRKVGGQKKSSFGAASAWGVLSVMAILGNALKRLTPVALQPFGAGDFTQAHWALYCGFSALMLYAEGYKGFHLKFSPMVVKRALTLDEDSGPLRILFAGPFSMGLFHSSKKRKIVSWSLAAGVFGLVQLVKRLPYPWRSIVDAGVVTGLSSGALSIAFHWIRSWFGHIPEISAEMPEKSKN